MRRSCLILLFSSAAFAPLLAEGRSSRSFTGLGITAGYDYGTSGNFAPAIALTQGVSGIFSYFGTVEAGYRTSEGSWLARAKAEICYYGIGVYGGIQSNTGSDRAADYGFPVGLALMLPADGMWLLKLHTGAAIYTKSHPHEFQVAAS